MKRNMLLIGICAILLSACGGGGGSTASATATGHFIDSKVSGLSYVSGSHSGVTGADGGFTYEPGQSVTFSLGGVTIGTATGKSVITPLDLVPGATLNTPAVINRVRFLMMLDTDNAPSNGISISAAVQAAATSWPAVNFGSTSFDTAVAQLVTDANTADHTTQHALPTGSVASGHLAGTWRCAYSGAFAGTYSGNTARDDSGLFGALVDAKTGDVIGVAYSAQLNHPVSIAASSAVSVDHNAAFTSILKDGTTDTGASFSGHFSTPDTVGGSWTNNIYGQSGTFTGKRIGGAANAVYRYTGKFTGDDEGVFAFDIDGSNHITGVAYRGSDGKVQNLSGSINTLGTVDAYTDDGTHISGTIDVTAGTIGGTWNNNGAYQGTYSGTGCRLN